MKKYTDVHPENIINNDRHCGQKQAVVIEKMQDSPLVF